MVGLVVVSHSRALALAAAALAREMSPGRQVRIGIAAGLDETTLGTDAVQILDAIAAADQGAGVVVLMDLGSALLSAELALDLLDEKARQRVLLCPAPLVEGLIAAAVSAAGGASREEVAAEAIGALAGKVSHLAAPATRSAVATRDPGATAVTGMFTVTPPHGLHARPASRLVQEVRAWDADVGLRNLTTDSPWVPASSLSRVATLGARHGHQLEVRASGRQAREAVEHVLTLAARAFDQDQGLGADVGERPTGGRAVGQPVPASPGIGIGPAFSTLPLPVVLTDVGTNEPTREWRLLQEALATVRQDVQQTRARIAREAGETAAAVFDAHLLLLEDPDLLGDVGARVRDGHAAAPAWSAAVTRVAEQLESLPDPYLRARAADVRALGDHVLRVMLGLTPPREARGGVLIAADLTPAEAAELDPAVVEAVVLAAGSVTAHSTILLRARGIPAVVGAGNSVLEIPVGTLLAVDGSGGQVVVDPSPQTLSRFRERAHDLQRRSSEARARASSPARTRDGIQIAVGANVGSVADAREAVANGADLAGLVRTEFLFLGRERAPDVEEQEAAYRAVADAFAGRRITLRTLDAGGDKPLPYLPVRAEANPVLGVRGIRLSLAEPTLLVDQLRAMVRVAWGAPVSVMFPMVSTLDELVRARRLLEDAILAEGRGPPADLRVGVMIEVPAAALTADLFAAHVDFLSIGTNDLTQYTLAAERGNDAVAAVGDAYDPGVLRLLQAVCRGVGEQKPVAVCGEMAADEHAVGLLVGLGVRELSVRPQAVPMIKQSVRDVDGGDARELAEAAVRADSATAVRALLTAS